MKSIRTLALVFAFAASLCGAASALADSHLSSDPAVTNARALTQAGRFDDALAILRPLDENGPDRIDILFLTGLAAMGAAGLRESEDERAVLLDEAIAALRAILIDRPELVRVRLELARAFFLKGSEDDDLSTEHFERVLAGNPPAAMAANIARFLDIMRARRRWSAYAGGAVAPDSNIGAASESEVIWIFGLPFRRDTQSSASSGVGVIVWGGGEYQYPLGDSVRLRAGADLARREYPGRRFDQTFGSLHLGPRWLANRNTELSVLATARRNWLDRAPRDHALGARVEVEHRISRRLSARGRAWWERRAFRLDDHLDGPLLGSSLGGAWVATPTLRIHADAGYGRERPHAESWRNASVWVRSDVSLALPFGFTLGGGVEYRSARFKGDWFPFTRERGVGRRDRTRTLRASVLNRSLTVYGFSPQLVAVREVRTSNAQLYDYQRTRFELRFQRQF